MPDSTIKTRDKKGRWQPGVSGNPQGRPITNPARQMLMEKAEDLMKKAISMALEGDTAALNTCISRIIPQYRPVQAPVSLEIDLDDNLSAIGRQVVAAAANGQCPPDVATNLLQGLGTLARITEIQELKERLEALERTLKQRRE